MSLFGAELELCDSQVHGCLSRLWLSSFDFKQARESWWFRCACFLFFMNRNGSGHSFQKIEGRLEIGWVSLTRHQWFKTSKTLWPCRAGQWKRTQKVFDVPLLSWNTKETLRPSLPNFPNDVTDAGDAKLSTWAHSVFKGLFVWLGHTYSCHMDGTEMQDIGVLGVVFVHLF